MNIRGIASIVACAVVVTAAAALGAGLQYPEPPRDGTVDDYHGQRVADPYRWMEEPARSEANRKDLATWLGQEARVTGHYFEAFPGRDHIRQRYEELSGTGEPGVPWREAGKLFWIETGHGPQGVLYALDKTDTTPRVFFDPNRISPDGSVAMGDFVVSPDGLHLSYHASSGGADAGVIRVRDIARDL
jgi:prolyl oligopeptidase